MKLSSLWLKNRGETITEAVIAFVIFSLGITFVGLIMGSAVNNMQNAKNRILAINIAREGIEGVRNIRDTNWLKFHSRRRECWNNRPTDDPTIPCTGNNPIEPGDYLIYKQGVPTTGGTVTYRWRMSDKIDNGSSSEPLQPVCGNENERILSNKDDFMYQCIRGLNGSLSWKNTAEVDVADIDPNFDTDEDNDLENDQDIYNHLYPEDGDALGILVKESPFRRVITIEYLANDGAIISSPSDPQWIGPQKKELNRIRITSNVSWQLKGVTFDVELVTHLSDYLGRESLDG